MAQATLHVRRCEPNKPDNEGGVGVHYLESVDNSLRLLLILAREPQIGVSDAANELGVAPSTAHRILSTMRYRGFAVQDGSRRYQAGPAFELLAGGRDGRSALVEAATPSLDRLRDATGETCHLSVLVGTQARVVASAESDQTLRVSSRLGSSFPAHLHAGGKAILAHTSDHDIARLYPSAGVPSLDLSATKVANLRRELARIRRQGYSLNLGQTERGVVAVAVTVRDGDGSLAALSVSLPTLRYRPAVVDGLVEELDRAATALEVPQRRTS